MENNFQVKRGMQKVVRIVPKPMKELPTTQLKVPIIKQQKNDSQLSKSEKRLSGMSCPIASPPEKFAKLENPKMKNKDARPVAKKDAIEAKDSERRRAPSSQDNQWIPANLIRNECFSQDGTLLSKDQCKMNLERALKNKKDIDFYDILKVASNLGADATPIRRLAETLAFQLYISGKQIKPIEKSIIGSEDLIVFDLKAAQEMDEVADLPGGQKILLTGLINESTATTFSGKTLESAMTRAILTIMQFIEKLDPMLALYTAPESIRKSQYPRLSQEFLDTFGKVLMAGFSIEKNKDSDSTVSNSVRCTVQNYLNKLRTTADETTKKERLEQLETFKESLKKDAKYRDRDQPIGFIYVRMEEENAVEESAMQETNDPTENVTLFEQDNHSDSDIARISLLKLTNCLKLYCFCRY